MINTTLEILLSSGGGGSAPAKPALGQTGQLVALLGFVLLLFIFSYLFSRMGYEYAEE